MIYKPFTNKSTPLIIEDIRECLKEDLPSQITIDTGDLPHLIGEIDRLKLIIVIAIRIYEKCEETQDYSTCDLDMYECLKKVYKN